MPAARKKAGSSDAIYSGTAKLEGMPYNLGVMNFGFMGGSMGSVVGEKIARLAHQYWMERGCPEGSPEEDWLRAEQDLQARPASGDEPEAFLYAEAV